MGEPTDLTTSGQADHLPYLMAWLLAWLGANCSHLIKRV
jgi:hypothetical protein